MIKFDYTLHPDDTRSELREFEYSLRKGQFGATLTPTDAMEALHLARYNGEQTSDYSMLSAEIRELITERGVRVEEVVRFIHDEFVVPYDRLLSIIKKNYSDRFGPEFKANLENELRILDADTVKLNKVVVQMEGEEDFLIANIEIEKYNSRSTNALTIMHLIKYALTEYPNKKILSIQFFYYDNSEST